MAVRLVIDEQRCEGHGRCYALHPELFEADDEGRGLVLVAELTDELQPKASQAVTACPEHAVVLVREGASE